MPDTIYPVTVPKWGIEMQEGTIVSWHIDEGATVSKGDELIDIETDKIINTMETPAAGVLRKRLVTEGETLSVGALLGIIAEESVSDADIDQFITDFKPADASFGFEDEAATPAAESQVAEAPPSQESQTSDNKVRVSPAAARRARELNIDITRVTGTGRGGRISTEDVEKFAEQQGSSSETTADYTSSPLSAIRKTIARRLVESKQQIPHFYLNTEIDLSRAMDRREQLNQEATVKVSVNDLMVRGTVLALQEFPQLNIHLVDEEVRQFANINMAIAVDTDDGLLTPVVRKTESLSITELSKAIKDLGLRARNNNLTPDDMRGGTFTVSNLGMFGITEFQAIINPPQGAILSIGCITECYRAVAGENTLVKLVKVGLACDHRVIDGALGAKFLACLKSVMEEATQL